MVLGEASKRLSDEFRGRYPEHPWRQIAGLRDRLIHKYDDVSYEQIWRVLSEDLPALHSFLDGVIPRQISPPPG
jgi:uncharacterized protein with HEPN domain